MADQGGYRRPNKPASYSGVGRNSRRTDGQAIRSPNVQDSTDLTQGDRRIIEQGQHVAPISRTREPSVQTPRNPQGLRDVLMQMPSNRPMEPPTEGLDMGPGAGSEVLTPPPPRNDKELVLQWLVDQFDDGSAHQMLQQMRQTQPQSTMPMPQPQTSAPTPTPVTPDEPEVTTDLDEQIV